MPIESKPLVERIHESVEVDPETGCWIWQKSGQQGYGQIWVGSRSDGTRQRLLAHRASYMAFVGDIPGGLQLDHLCRNHGCVNPDHLEAVTGRTNVLRGIAPAAVNARKRVCKRDHELTGDNIYVNQGKRFCRACRTIRDAARNSVAQDSSEL